MKITSPEPSLARYLPETASGTRLHLGDMADRLARYAGVAAGYLKNSAVSGPYSDLLAAQTEAQMQLMEVSLQSNLSRTEHETKMAIIRNVRVA